MSPTVVFLWISAAQVGSGAGLANDGSVVPSTGERARALLRDYGAARGLNFVEIHQAAPARPRGSWRTPEALAALADELEGQLEQAATSLSALEEAAALERLGRVEQTLLAHPDLPQASWLLAESFALRAAASSDPEAARLLEQRRAAIEGERALPFGDPRRASASASTTPPPLEVRGLDRSDLLEIDGMPRRGRFPLSPGLHQIRVLRGGRVIHAEFREIAAGTVELALDVPPLVPCSPDDLGTLDRDSLARGAAPPSGIACPRFALVRPARDGIEVSLCSPRACGPFVTWRERPERRFRPITVERGLPAWAGFAIAGATAVVATSLLLWQAGAFEEGRPSAARWEYDGLNPQSARGIRF